ncbi:MAG: ABC transporter permease [Crocinitomicaceae bacterium]|jgi:lipopolysaccharide transport system permease protein
MKETWTEVIQPKKSVFQLNLSEIWNYRDLIWIFVRRDIVSVYKQTVLGPLWFFLGPIFTVFTFVFVFNQIAKISTDNIPAPLFYLAGTTLWNYFQACITGTSSTFISNANIFGKVYFPRLVSPISMVISNLLKFGIQLLMFLCFWFYYLAQGSIHPNAYIALLPLLVLLMGGMALGVGIIISSLTTKYRDLSYFIGFGITLIMYATPVIYPVSAIPEMYKPFVIYNPIAPIIETFRYGFTGSGYFSWNGLIYSSVFTIVVLLIGTVLFNKIERTFMDTV